MLQIVLHQNVIYDAIRRVLLHHALHHVRIKGHGRKQTEELPIHIAASERIKRTLQGVYTSLADGKRVHIVL